MKIKNKHGITLIALVITVIILLILAGAAVSIGLNGGDVFNRANQAKTEWNSKVAEEGRVLNDLKNYIEQPEVNITIKINGEDILLNKSNFGQYLGKVVKNYTGAPTKIKDNTIIVSNQYRLYWIDFDNKYGEGYGTIYIKADYIESHPTISVEQVSSIEDSKVRELNPMLYKNGVENAPDENNPNMKALIYLTNPSSWDELKTGVNASLGNKVKYIVGAPSIEMMMDSYNAHYDLSGDTPDKTPRSWNTETKVKLFYKYPYDSNKFGYAVGPESKSSDGFSADAEEYTVYKDSEIDGMYYHYTAYDYLLASPSAYSSSALITVGNFYAQGRMMTTRTTNGSYGLCPLVCLASDAQLEL